MGTVYILTSYLANAAPIWDVHRATLIHRLEGQPNFVVQNCVPVGSD